MFFGLITPARPSDTVPCVVPAGLDLEIIPSPTCPSVIGRCGHPIGTRQTLVFEGTDYRLYDSATAMKSPHLHGIGYRPFGPIALLLGRSLVRCDTCKRKKEFKRTIICACSRTIAPGDPVAFVGCLEAKEHGAHHPRLESCVTTTFRRGRAPLTVVARECFREIRGMRGNPGPEMTWNGTMVEVWDEFDML